MNLGIQGFLLKWKMFRNFLRIVNFENLNIYIYIYIYIIKYNLLNITDKLFIMMLALIYFRWMEIEHGCVTYLPTSHSKLEF